MKLFSLEIVSNLKSLFYFFSFLFYFQKIQKIKLKKPKFRKEN